MCLRPIHFGTISYPCGKCDECLKQMEYRLGFAGMCNVFNGNNKSSKYDSVHSITLTYDDEHLPLICQTVVIDHFVHTYYLIDFEDDFVHVYEPNSHVRNLLSSMDSKDSMRYLWKNFQSSPESRSDGVLWLSKFKPSKECLEKLQNYQFGGYLTNDTIFDLQLYNNLDVDIASFICAIPNPKDLQNFIKTLRIYYKRIFGKNMNMTYTAVAEYGPKTCRPHFHICMFTKDVDETFIKCFIRMGSEKIVTYKNHRITNWKKGNSLVSSTSCFNTSDACNMAKYTAKYGKKQSKGKHIIERCNLVPKFRRFSSKGFNECAIQIAKDIILKDIPYTEFFDCFEAPLPTYEDCSELWNYAKIINDRLSLKYNLYGKEIRIPRYFVRQALSLTYESYVTKKFITIDGHEVCQDIPHYSTKTSILWKASNALQGFVDINEFEESIARCNSHDLDKISTLYNDFWNAKKNREQYNKLNFGYHDRTRYTEPSIN